MEEEKKLSGTKANPILNPAFGLSGFGLLLGWHFIILFNSMQYEGLSTASEFMLIRQVSINASLCVFFLLGGIFLSKFPPRDRIESHAHLYISMVAGVLGTIGLMLFSYLGVATIVVSVIFIGASEATMMLLWLRFYTETSKNYSGQTLGISAVFASLISFFTYHLTFDMVVIVTVMLPVISGISLIVTTRGIPLRHNEPYGINKSDWSQARKPYVKSTVQLMAMATFFGFIQGCYSPGNMLLPMTDPASILGAAFAGVVIYVIYSRSEFLPQINPIISISIIIFIAGILLLPFQNGTLSRISAFLIMTGFIVYFLLVLILIIDLVRTFDLNLTKALGYNQSLEYLMFAVSILGGYFLWGQFGEAPYTVYVIASACAFVFVCIVLIFSTERPPWRASYYKNEDDYSLLPTTQEESGEDVYEKNKKPLLEVVSIKYNLTTREVEVFELLAKGRNAEYIQNALVISNHTVKTHIYNIYKKLDVHSLQELLDIVDLEKNGDSYSDSQDITEDANGANADGSNSADNE